MKFSPTLHSGENPYRSIMYSEMAPTMVEEGTGCDSLLLRSGAHA